MEMRIPTRTAISCSPDELHPRVSALGEEASDPPLESTMLGEAWLEDVVLAKEHDEIPMGMRNAGSSVAFRSYLIVVFR